METKNNTEFPVAKYIECFKCKRCDEIFNLPETLDDNHIYSIDHDYICEECDNDS